MLGFLVQWPTILTLIMFPILVLVYKKLARSEERDALAEFGEEYSHYIAEVPGLFQAFDDLKKSKLYLLSDIYISTVFNLYTWGYYRDH